MLRFKDNVVPKQIHNKTYLIPPNEIPNALLSLDEPDNDIRQLLFDFPATILTEPARDQLRAQRKRGAGDSRDISSLTNR